jgi:hypothetical protein
MDLMFKPVPDLKPCFAFYEFQLRPLRECIKCSNYPRCKSETFLRRNGERELSDYKKAVEINRICQELEEF